MLTLFIEYFLLNETNLISRPVDHKCTASVSVRHGVVCNNSSSDVSIQYKCVERSMTGAQ